MSTGHFQKLPQAYKFMIGTVPETGEEPITVEAQYNPKELQIESPIAWTEHKVLGAQVVATKPMEFSGMGAETMKVELVFDAFEEDSDYVVESIAALKRMASVNEKLHVRRGKFERPCFCVATWGTQQAFRCVIESIVVKYTMFSVDGTPLRATVTLGLKSGRRELEASENSFERASRERLEEKRTRLLDERDQRARQRELDREREREEEQAARQRADRERRKKEYQLE